MKYNNKILFKFEKDLNHIYRDIHKECGKCGEKDCRGYIWLLKGETQRLIDNDISVIEINKKINFINTLCENKDKLNFKKISPKCIFRDKDKKCKIYKYRPLICKLYPIDFKIINNNFFIVLHTNCLFVKNLTIKNKLNKFIEKVLNLFYNINIDLLLDIIKTYKLIDNITKYSKDYKHNDYIKIIKINLKNKNMSKCKAVLDSEKISELKIRRKKDEKDKKKK
jgi:Fe-S-cluster containining protein